MCLLQKLGAGVTALSYVIINSIDFHHHVQLVQAQNTVIPPYQSSISSLELEVML